MNKTDGNNWMTSFFKRIVGGFFILITSTCLLWWSEKHLIRTADPAWEAKSAAIPVNNISVVDPGLHGKLILASGEATSKEVLKDDIFGVGVSAVRLLRNVEYYQWVETKEKRNTYTYDKQWVSKPINSSSFSDENYQKLNFTLTQIENRDFIAKRVSFGDYELPDFLIREMSGNLPTRVRMTDNQIEQWEDALLQSLEAIRVVSNPRLLDSTQLETNLVHLKENIVYFGFDPDSPQIGDVKVIFEQIPSAEITIVAQNDDFSFEKYKAKNGATYSCVKMGAVSPDVVFQQASDPNTLTTWVIRILLVVCTIIGFGIFFSFFVLLNSPATITYCLVQSGTNLAAAITGLMYSSMLLGCIWFNYYRFISIGLFLLAIACLCLLVIRIRMQWRQLDFDSEDY